MTNIRADISIISPLVLQRITSSTLDRMHGGLAAGGGLVKLLKSGQLEQIYVF